jgi:hypothetical protein
VITPRSAAQRTVDDAPAYPPALARLHRQNRFDRMTSTVTSFTRQPARTIEAFVAEHAAVFTALDGVSNEADVVNGALNGR